ncbi:MAG TPA: hypothetical protein VFN87_06105 [Solirubrobacteraceae bacterium]|nr:hypothetical protein [Solirubrobacteraceae bacterium]
MKAPVFQVGRVGFQLDRFELVDGERCEVEGRWSGVRGRRFMRPALTLVIDGHPTRLLADLADKPWAAEDGEPWRAAFPCPFPGGDLAEAELSVGPDVTIALPPPTNPAGTGRKRRRAGTRARETPPGRGPVTAATPPAPAGAPADGGAREIREARSAQRRLERQLERAEADRAEAAARIERLTNELAQAEHERDQARAECDRQAAEREALEGERRREVADRDAARRTSEERTAERDAAQRAHQEALETVRTAELARDSALGARDAALTAQARATAERDEALADRDAALAERDTAEAARDAALADRAQALRERDAAGAAREQAMTDREALARTNERLQAELTDLLSARGAAMVMRRAAQETPASRPYAGMLGLLPLAVAAIAAAAIVVVVLLVGGGL